MPRVDSTARTPMSRAASRPRAKKAAVLQDRLTQRTLFFRRVRRSVKPGLWVLGGVCVLVVGSELVRSLPATAPVPQTVPQTVHHTGGGLAALGAAVGLRISDAACEVATISRCGVRSLKQGFGRFVAARGDMRSEHLGYNLNRSSGDPCGP